MSWSEFLAYLSEPNGIAVFAGIAWSLLIEYVNGFKVLEPKYKRLVFFGVCMVAPLAAAGLR